MKASPRTSFLQDLKKIKDKQVLKKIEKIVEAVKAADQLADVAGVKKLKVPPSASESETFALDCTRLRVPSSSCDAFLAKTSIVTSPDSPYSLVGPDPMYFSSHAENSRCHSREFCGFSTQ